MDVDAGQWRQRCHRPRRVALIGGANQTVLFSLANLSDSDIGQQLLVTVQLTKTSAAPPVTYTLLFDLTVIQCDAITLEPTVLPPVVVGAAYTQNLVANGANHNFTWSVISSSLPPGLTWDASSHKLSGTVTDATQPGKAFSLVLGVAAFDVIMDPLTALLGITVQSASAVASDMPPWERYLIILGSGVGIMALAAIALNRLLGAKANAKTIEALKAGNTNVENATNGNPKSISQSIVRAERQRLPIVRGNIPYNLDLIDHVTRIEEDLSGTLAKGEALIAKMGEYLHEYLEDHPSPNPNDPVEDSELIDQNWTTIGALELGITLVESANKAWRNQLFTVTNWLNGETTTTVSDQITIDGHSITEHNENSLLIT